MVPVSPLVLLCFATPMKSLSFASTRFIRYRSSFSNSVVQTFSTKAPDDVTKDRLFPEEINIFYDSKCNVCRLEMEWLRRRDRDIINVGAPKIRLTDLESPTFDMTDPANAGIDYERGMKSMTAVTADGRILQGVPVFRLAYEQVGLGWLFQITQWPVMNVIFDMGYKIFAKYRTLFTRGAHLDTLIQAYEEKKALEATKRKDTCVTCQPEKKNSP